ncbi:MAG TPA: hypothetical protein VK615_05345 [Candidatus Binatia bacterium]|nr:hypothetical protein [Candidatus Binatia bacterium]
MRIKKVAIFGVGAIILSSGVYAALVLQDVRAAKAKFISASAMKVTFTTVQDGKQKTEEINVGDANKIRKVGEAVFKTVRPNVLFSRMRRDESLSTALWMHFEATSNTNHVADIMLLGFDRVIVDDKWIWDASIADTRGDIIGILRE